MVASGVEEERRQGTAAFYLYLRERAIGPSHCSTLLQPRPSAMMMIAEIKAL